MVNAEATFSKVPAIVGWPAICLPKIVVQLVAAVNAIIGVFAELAAIASTSHRELHVAAATVNEPPLSISGTLAHDTDHTIHRVGAPYRCARTADHFDPVHIVE